VRITDTSACHLRRRLMCLHIPRIGNCPTGSQRVIQRKFFNFWSY